MKTFYRCFAVVLAVMFIAPALIADSPDKKNDDEPVIKRIFVRDGEVIEIKGDQSITWNSDHLDLGRRTYLGVSVIDISGDLRQHFGAPADRGVLVSQVGDDTPARKSGLKAGDVVLSIDGEAVDSSGDLRRLIRDHEANESVEIEIVRDGAPQTIFATLEEREMKLRGRIRLDGDDHGFRYRIDQSDESLKRLNEFFESPAWKSRAMKIQDCTEIQEKLEVMQKRLSEMEKKLEKMK